MGIIQVFLNWWLVGSLTRCVSHDLACHFEILTFIRIALRAVNEMREHALKFLSKVA